MKLNYRKEHKPESISVLDYTIIAVLAKEIANQGNNTHIESEE